MNTCRDCSVNLQCLAGRIPDNWICQFICKHCGKSRWLEIRRPYAGKNRNLMHEKYCAFITENAITVSICPSCYLKREMEIDADPSSWAVLPRQNPKMWGP